MLMKLGGSGGVLSGLRVLYPEEYLQRPLSENDSLNRDEQFKQHNLPRRLKNYREHHGTWMILRGNHDLLFCITATYSLGRKYVESHTPELGASTAAFLI